MRAPSDCQKRALLWKLKVIYQTLIENGVTIPPSIVPLIESPINSHQEIDLLNWKRAMASCDVSLGKTAKAIRKLAFLLEELYGIIDHNGNAPISPKLLMVIRDIMLSVPTCSMDRICTDAKLRCIINSLVPTQLTHLSRILEDDQYQIPEWSVSFTGFSIVIKAKRFAAHNKLKTKELVTRQSQILDGLNDIIVTQSTDLPFNKDDLINIMKQVSWVPANPKETDALLKESDQLQEYIWDVYGYSLW